MDKEFKITGANAPKKFRLLDRRRWTEIIGKQSILIHFLSDIFYVPLFLAGLLKRPLI
jgi:hypothetical protein